MKNGGWTREAEKRTLVLSLTTRDRVAQSVEQRTSVAVRTAFGASRGKKPNRDEWMPQYAGTP
jgi:hypothetical protein